MEVTIRSNKMMDDEGVVVELVYLEGGRLVGSMEVWPTSIRGSNQYVAVLLNCMGTLKKVEVLPDEECQSRFDLQKTASKWGCRQLKETKLVSDDATFQREVTPLSDMSQEKVVEVVSQAIRESTTVDTSRLALFRGTLETLRDRDISMAHDDIWKLADTAHGEAEQFDLEVSNRLRRAIGRRVAMKVCKEGQE